MARRAGTPRRARLAAALVLLTALVGSVLAGSGTASADPDVLITDVSETHPFAEAISWMASQGITTGYPNGDGSFAFRPSDPVLREQAAAFLYRYQWGNDGDQFPGPSGFTDVSDTHRFKQHIQWLAGEGITQGYDNGDGTLSFRPSAPVLREQVAAFLFRYHFSGPVLVAPQDSPFTDVPSTHTFYPAIYWAWSVGITTGYANGDGTYSFRPSAPVLREQFAAFLYRYDQELATS